MQLARMRFTLRRTMAVIAVAAIVLAFAHRVRRRIEFEQQQALLEHQIAVNQLAQVEMKGVAEQAKRRAATPGEIEGIERTRQELRQEGSVLHQRRLQLQR